MSEKPKVSSFELLAHQAMTLDKILEWQKAILEEQRNISAHLEYLRTEQGERAQVAGDRVTVSDVDISFGNLVGLLVKATVAAIPAGIIVMALAAFALAILSSCGAGLLGLGGLAG